MPPKTTGDEREKKEGKGREIAHHSISNLAAIVLERCICFNILCLTHSIFYCPYKKIDLASLRYKSKGNVAEERGRENRDQILPKMLL